ncbi:MAG: hypothetical protein ACK5NT_12745 [Pyrinomonadaceae bacterium]
MQKPLITLLAGVLIAMNIVFFPLGTVSTIFVIIGFGVVYVAVRNAGFDETTVDFLISVFIVALVLRLALASLIYGMDLQGSFGPDAFTYDSWGNELARKWDGLPTDYSTDFNRVGWGMPYIVGVFYYVIGRNPLAIQVISCVLGAASALLTYVLSDEIIGNKRVAKYSAVIVAVFPAMIIWTSQLLKEGFIIFALLLSLLAAWNLKKRITPQWLIMLVGALLMLFMLRSYIFGMVVIAIVSGFVIAPSKTNSALIGRFIACMIIAFGFSFAGVWQLSEDQFQKLGDLDQIQQAREYASESANSGIDNSTDIRSTGGIITALPLGFVTLLFAPFPWQVSSMTQALTMPEMVVWWLSLPFLVAGLLFAIRHRLRRSMTVLVFVAILTLAYSLTQGNLGTIYRQRAQIQIFLLQFVAVGLVLQLEKRENAKLVKKYKRKSLGLRA